MARTNNLVNYLTDVANSIKSQSCNDLNANYQSGIIGKKIQASQFDGTINDNLRSHKTTPMDNNPNAIVSYLIYSDSISSIDFTGYNISCDNIEAEYLFRGFYNLTSINGLSSDYFMTGNCTSFKGMFEMCEGLSSLDVSFDTSNCVIMENMFAQCINLTSINLNIDTSNCEDFAFMFSDCSSLESIYGIENFDVGKGIVFSNMFTNCQQLLSLDLSNWYPTNMGYADYMFSDCQNLNFLDIRNFELSNVENTEYIFYGVNPTCEIIVKDDTEKGWIESNYPELENVKTVQEYEG